MQQQAQPVNSAQAVTIEIVCVRQLLRSALGESRALVHFTRICSA
jgi:hypothetical protein